MTDINSALKGNCFICGKTTSKTAMKNHILKDHNIGDEKCYLIKAEDPYNKDYWLFFSVPITKKLEVVDGFLRKIWCECCGHLSAFRKFGKEVSGSAKISVLNVGDKLLYEYDFGSTTEIVLTVISEISRVKHQKAVQLIARNEPFKETCDTCGAPAIYVDTDEMTYVCDDCADEEDYEGDLLPIVNSPRMGVCGYEGEEDIWTFNPDDYKKK